MALKKVARQGDVVKGHLDVQGTEIVGSITTSSTDVLNGSVGVARTDDTITIPVHAHQLTPGPSDFRSHTWRVIGTSKHNANNRSIMIDGDGGNDADGDGFQTLPSQSFVQATTTDFNSSN